MSFDPDDNALEPLKGYISSKPITSVDDAVEMIGWGKYQTFLLFVAAIVWMMDAMEIMLMSFLPVSAVCSFPITEAEASLLSTIIFFGMAVGATFFGWISDRFGRRIGFIAGSGFTVVAALCTIFANSFWTLALCRVFVGFGVASSHVPVALFTEYSPKSGRGKGIIFLAIVYSMGLMISIGLAWGCLGYFPKENAWRYLVGFTAIPVVIVLLISPFVPESSRWLFLHDKREKAIQALQRAAKWNNRVKQCDFSNVTEIPKKSASLMELLSPDLRVTSLLLWVTWFILTFEYYGAILIVVEQTSKFAPEYVCPSLYSNTATNTTNQTESLCTPIPVDSYIDMLITTSGELPGIIITMYFVDKIGRKKTAMFFFLVSSGCIFSLFICYPTYIATGVMFVLRAANTGAFQTVWLYTPEVYPTSVRTLGVGVSLTISRFGGMAAPYGMTYLVSISTEGHMAALGLAGSFCIVAFICVLLLPIETKGRALQESSVGTGLLKTKPKQHYYSLQPKHDKSSQ